MNGVYCYMPRSSDDALQEHNSGCVASKICCQVESVFS